MKKAYEVTYKDGNEIRTATVKGHTLIGALLKQLLVKPLKG